MATNLITYHLERKCAFFDNELTVYSYNRLNWGTVVLLVVNGFFSLTATVFNLLVILAIWKSPLLQTPKYTILCSLCVSDFFVGVVSSRTSHGKSVVWHNEGLSAVEVLRNLVFLRVRWWFWCWCFVSYFSHHER